MKASETPPRLKSRWRYFLITLAAFAVTVALFYAEEDWRGWRAMEKCKRELAAQGEDLNWSEKIPAPVPENENVFGVPEMQNWFVKHDTNFAVAPGRIGTASSNELTSKFNNPARDNPARMIVAKLTIGPMGATPPPGCAVIQWGSPTAGSEMRRLIKEVVGPVAMDPSGPYYTKQQPQEIQPVHIFLQGLTQPGDKELQKFLPKPLVADDAGSYENVRIESVGDGSYEVTMRTPTTAAEFLKLNEQLEPAFTLIRAALQRPFARMDGNYQEFSETPIPNFVALRIISQRLAAIARCHLLLDQPEEAGRDLTLIHDICRRILEENKPMTLVSAMINVAMRGIYASVLADGLQTHAWSEPQLTVLEGQLKQINLLKPAQEAFKTERFSLCYTLLHDSAAHYFDLFDPYNPIFKTNSTALFYHKMLVRFIPRGWAWQNMLNGAHYYTNVIDAIDPSSRTIIGPKDTGADLEHSFYSHAFFPHWSPYFFMAVLNIPNFSRACHTCAQNQTKVNQALIACALERYRVAHGQYPEKLDAIIPEFIDAIPHDVIGGQPPHYRRNSDGTFLLYSIGWDGLDHHGAPDADLVWPEEN